MSDLIKREDAIAALWDMTTEDCPNAGAAVGKSMDVLRHLPSVREQGEWIPLNTELPMSAYLILSHHYVSNTADKDTFEIVRIDECEYGKYCMCATCHYQESCTYCADCIAEHKQMHDTWSCTKYMRKEHLRKVVDDETN